MIKKIKAKENLKKLNIKNHKWLHQKLQELWVLLNKLQKKHHSLIKINIYLKLKILILLDNKLDIIKWIKY